MYPIPGETSLHHFGYGLHNHRWAQLASRKLLQTMCQNWDDGRRYPLAESRGELDLPRLRQPNRKNFADFD